jgi:hypothetical protein
MEPVMKNGTKDENSVIIDDVKIFLRSPDLPDSFWVGQKEVFRLLTAAWMKTHAYTGL